MITTLLFLVPFFLSTFAQNGPSNWTIAPFNPPALPLAVRSPYLNIWLPQGNNPQAAYTADNVIWSDNAVQWYTSVAVDGTEYRLLSPWAPGEKTANQTAVEFTATRTSFLMEVPGIRFNMSFLSPIEPSNFTLQSLPFAYMYMTAESSDGLPHRVLMYSDIEGNLVAGDVHQLITWDADESDDYVVLSTRLQRQQPFAETFAQAQDGVVSYSFKKIVGSTTAWRISGFNSARGLIFSQGGRGALDKTIDPNFRAPASGNDTPVFGITIDWGNVTGLTPPAVWTLGFYRNVSILSTTPTPTATDDPAQQLQLQLQPRTPYFMSSLLKDHVAAAKFVLADFPRALSTAEAFDAKIRSAGLAVSTQYAELLALSARQAMGSLEITLPLPNHNDNHNDNDNDNDNAGSSWDMSDVKIFMKNIGGAGSDMSTSLSSVNNVGVLYSAFPVFLYLNPDIGGGLLAPLLEIQDSGTFTLGYAAKYLGTRYPNATADGINDEHRFGVDGTASMLIMTLAYSMASGNGTLISKHYGLMRKWALYLESNAIMPVNQATGDINVNLTLPPANQTNLALKGIIAIGAMAKMAEVVGNTSDQQYFHESARKAIDLWQAEAISSSGVGEVYGAGDGSGLVYNLYADKLLRLNLVPKSVYDACTTSYQSLSTNLKYGIPLSQSSRNTSTNWMLFAASTVNDNTTRDALISQVHRYASSSLNNAPFASLYDPSTGLSDSGSGSDSGRASPAQGGIFALLALDTTSKTISVSPSPGSPSNSPHPQGSTSGGTKLSAGAIAGLVIASLAAIGCSAAVVFILRRRRSEKNRLTKNSSLSYVIEENQASISHVDPFAVTEPYTSERYAEGPHTGTYTYPSPSASVTESTQLSRNLARIRELESQSQSQSQHRHLDGYSVSYRDGDGDDLTSNGSGAVDSLRQEVELLRGEQPHTAPPSYYI